MNKSLRSVVLGISVLTLSACSGGGGGGDGTNDTTGDLPTRAEIKSNLKAAAVKVKASGTFTEINGEVQGSWSGSGFFVGDSGYIVTNNHVATGAGVLTIEGDGFSGSASAVAFAECADLAVLKLTSANTGAYSSLEWYQGTPEVGMSIAVGGYAGNLQTGEEGSYTYFEGEINRGVEEENTNWSSVDGFVHSAVASAGNSGGPVVELTNGKVVGVHYAGFADDNNRKVAISSSVAKRYVERMITGEDILSIGITGSVVYSNGNAAGVWVKAVRTGGKASATGIKPGDLITSIEGVSLAGSSSDVKTLKRYCSVLETNMGSNSNNVFSIEISRASSGESCVGEINGSSLALKGNTSQSCPEQSPPPPPPPGPGIPGSLSASDATLNDGSYYDDYPVTATRSGTATVQMTSSSFDTYIWVYSPAGGNALVHGRNSVTFNITNGERYIVRANSFSSGETGSYVLSLGDALELRDDGPQDPTISGALNSGDQAASSGVYFDGYGLTVGQSGSATITMNSSSFRSVIIVVDAGGTLVESDEASSVGGTASVTFNVTSGEIYSLVALSATPNQTGGYSLVFTDNFSDITEIN